MADMICTYFNGDEGSYQSYFLAFVVGNGLGKYEDPVWWTLGEEDYMQESKYRDGT